MNLHSVFIAVTPKTAGACFSSRGVAQHFAVIKPEHIRIWAAVGPVAGQTGDDVAARSDRAGDAVRDGLPSDRGLRTIRCIVDVLSAVRDDDVSWMTDPDR